MSTFGDATPKEDMLIALKGVQYDHKLSLAAFLTALLEVCAYLAGFGDHWDEYMS